MVLDYTSFLSTFAQGHGVAVLGLAILVFYVAYSLILLYHWLRYGLNPFTVLLMMTLYFGVSLPLLGVVLRSASALIAT